MRQRVGLARALVVHPKVLLMDEPFSALDVLTAETLRTDILDLWCEGQMPIRSILMVTHNIEEAVLMCDRILVFSSNPGRILAEIKVDLPGPPNRLAGLIELVAAEPHNGRADLPAIGGDFLMEVDDLFPVAEVLQLLRFAEVEHGDIRLTEAGRRFARAGLDERKRMFAQHVVTYVPLAGHIKRVLDERAGHRAPASRFRGELEDSMSEELADQTLRAVISWARYAEVFAYDEDSGVFSLENPT